ncbi:MAG: acetylornithine deacetylase [Cellvibrio sp.]
MNYQEYQQRLAQLIALPSISCAIKEWDMSNRGVIDCLANWFDALGFCCRIQEVSSGKFNLIAVLGADNGEEKGGLILSGHSDTVPYDADKWQSDPFTLTQKDDKLYGLGATDMKGFFPLIVETLKAFENKPPKHPLIVLATADEESSMAGARALMEQGIGFKPNAAVIGEPTNLTPIHMHKGIMIEAIRVEGKSGHSSNPALGNNALEGMNEVMTTLIAYREELQLRYRNPGFQVQVPTMNLGCIHGGDGANRICASCELHFDIRLLPGMDTYELRNGIRQRLRPIAETRKLDIVLSSLFDEVNPFHEPETSELVKLCEELTGQRSQSVAFATEAPFIQKLGAQTIILGAGSIDQAHQPDEFISLDQLQPAVKMLQSLIKHYCY